MLLVCLYFVYFVKMGKNVVFLVSIMQLFPISVVAKVYCIQYKSLMIIISLTTMSSSGFAVLMVYLQ